MNNMPNITVVKQTVTVKSRKLSANWRVMEWDPVFLGLETLDGNVRGTWCCHDTDIKTLGALLLSHWCTQPRVQSLVTEFWIDMLTQDINKHTFYTRKEMQDMGASPGVLQYDCRNLIHPRMNRMYLWDSTNQEWLAKAHPESQWRSLMQMVLEL